MYMLYYIIYIHTYGARNYYKYIIQKLNSHILIIKYFLHWLSFIHLFVFRYILN